MEVRFVEKAKDGGDALNTVKVHAKVGDVIIQIGHKYHDPHHILFKIIVNKLMDNFNKIGCNNVSP